MKCYEEACRLLPKKYRSLISEADAEKIEEFRLRTGRRLSALAAGCEYELGEEIINDDDLLYVLEVATDASVHRCSRELRNGYISRHGLRIGVCGQLVPADGKAGGFISYSSLCIRIPHRCEGICDSLYEKMYAQSLSNVLLVSPPGYGKTTALRELIRLLADAGARVGVVDERNELSGGGGERPGFELGRCSDVLTGIRKTEGSMMLLRGMNPQVIAMDEISKPEDLKTVFEVCGCGVNILATAHGKNEKDMLSRPVYRELVESGIFDWIVIISVENGNRKYEAKKLTA